jgi:hypothetical protein
MIYRAFDGYIPASQRQYLTFSPDVQSAFAEIQARL